MCPECGGATTPSGRATYSRRYMYKSVVTYNVIKVDNEDDFYLESNSYRLKNIRREVCNTCKALTTIETKTEKIVILKEPEEEEELDEYEQYVEEIQSYPKVFMANSWNIKKGRRWCIEHYAAPTTTRGHGWRTIERGLWIYSIRRKIPKDRLKRYLMKSKKRMGKN